MPDLLRFSAALFARPMKTEGGLKFPAEAYAYVPDPAKPSEWKLRLWETPDTQETAAQVGRAAAALSAGGFRGNPAEIPAKDVAAVKRKVRAAWKRVNPDAKPDEMPESIKMAASFAVADPEAGVVRHYGKLFETGDYPDKRFSLTAEEMAAAVDAFQPVAVNLAHTPTLLDNKLGVVEAVELSEDGRELYGTVALPVWLDTALGEAARTVSTEWDRGTKRLAGLALEVDPRVPDAVIMAAFSAAQEGAPPMPTTDIAALFAATKMSPEGQSILQTVHDMTARAGAVHKRDGKATYHTAPELDALQSIHDASVNAGATCPMDLADSNAPNLLMPGMARYSANKESPVDKSLWDQIKAYFSAAGVQVPDEPPTATVATPAAASTPSAPATPSAADAAMMARYQQLEAENARLRAESIQREAVTFVDKYIEQGHVVPAERPSLIEQYAQALRDDSTLGAVTFADGNKGSRAAQIERTIASRPPHMLTTERVPANLMALVNLAQQPDPKKQGTDPDTIRELIALTPAGQAHLSARNGSSN